MSTIYEVAALAGVSPATVSRVFNGITVSPEKSELVRRAATELAFTPNRAARSLRTRSSEVIALVIPDIENPFFTAMARGVEDVAQEAGYSVVLCNTDENPDKEAKYLSIAVSENMAGVILAAANDQVDLTALLTRRRPVVAVDRGPHGFTIDAVLVDNIAGGRAATQALADRGFTRIACITGPRDVETAQQRADGWRDVARPDNGDDSLRYANFRVDGGRAAMESLLAMDPPPDAVFVANNLMSVGALQVLVERGQTPGGIGLASLGDLPFSTVAPTDVTVIPLPARHLGMTAARLLLARIRGDDQPARSIVVGNGAPLRG
ncbi:LacI family DNA-binding transcriptional regulator [Glaciibacter psychrotolerans]|uniref:LacI family transcriptional regulator n=1 Tax=Glaciibacter psychrotolerans TaxID=670054 RepID=A0A7Z0J639_9MICO|nr:LacI family DNA-binding transcriptional regulator [Leifsonia psychrotolerans]NYJ19985.1 LacI family transcriptional regulator [Leifsonia psychrotolerans]